MSIAPFGKSTERLASAAGVVALGVLILGLPLELFASQFVVAPGGSDAGPGAPFGALNAGPAEWRGRPPSPALLTSISSENANVAVHNGQPVEGVVRLGPLDALFLARM